jgi:hypothetical protein
MRLTEKFPTVVKIMGSAPQLVEDVILPLWVPEGYCNLIISEQGIGHWELGIGSWKIMNHFFIPNP